MSNPTPLDGSDTDVIVQARVAGAAVTATAHYRTTTTTRAGRADGQGRATIVFHIGGATPGRPVPVSVTVAAGGTTRSCSTVFTPL
jgi:hypothetical protein